MSRDETTKNVRHVRSVAGRRMARMTGAVIGLCASGAALSSPPPPPPPWLHAVAGRIVSGPTPATLADYEGDYDIGVRVFSNGALIAANRADWMRLVMFHYEKIDRQVIGVAEGEGDVMVVDQVDDRSNVPDGVLADPRWTARSMRYLLNDAHRIVRIDILTVPARLVDRRMDQPEEARR